MIDLGKIPCCRLYKSGIPGWRYSEDRAFLSAPRSGHRLHQMPYRRWCPCKAQGRRQAAGGGTGCLRNPRRYRQQRFY